MPASTQDYLYDASLLPQELAALLPSGLTLRPLASSDYARGHLQLLTHLTSAPDVGQDTWTARFKELQAVNAAVPSYFPVVIVEDESDRLVGHACVFLERKFLRNAGLCGHIEDVVVDPRMQGKKLGLKLIEVLTVMSEHLGAYKTILDCDPKNEAFYAKCGYENKGCEMARYKK
ncbi:GNAT family acetyltransferase [Rhodotorula taiwanensis]|uniref:Glucosamine 6-phosphate N-acetyltransferase n=1 Tax=Rhodotorula taiwanensis TaxID=741276 RepID=A0A2S5B361_9BASI|nr:GNAT family acetyltransferase [Rhodotorula taiwanensis]